VRRSGWGVAAIAAYLAVAALTFRLADVPVRPLFDGFHGEALPYRWVVPPEAEIPFNLPPEPGQGTIAFVRGGSKDADFRTADLQATVTFPPGAFEPRDGERGIDVTITPLDPEEVGPAPPGSEHQGNAYEVQARYAGSGEPAPTTARGCDLQAVDYTCAAVFLRSPFGAVDIARWDGAVWQTLPDAVETGGDIFGPSPELGTFVALAEEGRIAASIAARGGVPSSGTPLRDIIAIAFGGLAVIVTSGLYRARNAGRRREEAKRRAAGKKYRPPERKGRGAPARKT
jgi:hypothetical protein